MFGPGLALQVRMAVALLLNGVLLAALLFVAGWLLTTPDGWSVVAIVVVLAVVGATARGRRGRRRRPKPCEVERARRILARLRLVGDAPGVLLVPEPERIPLSWTTAVPLGLPKVHVTTGLLEKLDERELEAVLAHELAHVLNRDAMLMTVITAPGVYVLRGLRATWHSHDTGARAKLGVVMFGVLLGPPALVSAGLARIVSRHRELAADRGAALLTGSPAGVASALLRLSDGVRAIPDRDLRTVAARDLLHFLPVRPESTRGVRRLWATHPSLEVRLRELERLEERLQRS